MLWQLGVFADVNAIDVNRIDIASKRDPRQRNPAMLEKMAKIHTVSKT